MIVDIVYFNSLSESSHQKVLCRCDGCGNERMVPKCRITTKAQKDYTYCKKCRMTNGALSRVLTKIKSDSYAGTRVNKLTILEYLGRTLPNRHYYWKCRCDCGVEKAIRGDRIQNGTAYSCGCKKQLNPDIIRTRTEKGVTGFNSLFGKYKIASKRRELEFSLTKEQFYNLTTNNCFYCGCLPKQKAKGSSFEVTAKTLEYGMFYHNGIDRVNNDIGYLIDNCVTCCKVCNYAKHTMKYEDFLEWIDNLVVYRKHLQVEEVYNLK